MGNFFVVPIIVARCLHVRKDVRESSSERWKFGQEHCPRILHNWRLPRQ